MLRKILIVLVVLGLSVTFGCKKTDTETTTKSSVNVKESEKDGKTTTETVKKEVIKETETAVKEANAAK